MREATLHEVKRGAPNRGRRDTPGAMVKREERIMKSDTDLDLVFKNAIGKKVTLNIEEPKPGVTKAEIDAAMQTVVENNVFNSTGGDLVEAVEGCLRTVTRDVVAE